MSHLLSRIMLALFMLPLATVLYMILIVSLMEFGFSNANDEFAFLFTNLITAMFVVLYWSFLWKKSVQWTNRRIGFSIAAGAASIVAGVTLGLLVSFVDE